MEKPVWVAMLAKMVAPMEAEHAAKALAAMLPMLPFPPEAFTLESLREVCSAGQLRGIGGFGPMTRVPTLGELEAAIGRWWGKRQELASIRQQPIARLASPEPAPRSPTQEEIDYVVTAVRLFTGSRTPNNELPLRQQVKPRHLSEGQLAEVYRRNGVRNPRETRS